jgi:hypothetical protein
MASVFIAHASENKDVAQDLFYALTKSGLEAYIDEKSLQTGEQFHNKLRDLILSSDYFVFLISPHSIESESYCLTELKFAEEKWVKESKGFIPVMIESVPQENLPAFIRQSNYLSPKGNVTAEVVSEILSKEQGATVDELEAVRQARLTFAKRYFDEDLGHRQEWYSRSAAMLKKQQLFSILVIAIASGSIITIQFIPMSEVLHRIISVLFAVFILLISITYMREPWLWKTYVDKAERMKSEYRRYVAMISPYTVGLGELRARELFVESVEEIVKD